MRSFLHERSCSTSASLPRHEIRGSIEAVIADELWHTLLRFHREVVAPDIDRMVVSRIEPLRDELAAFGRETHANFDAVLSHFDRLESEYHALRAAVLT